MPIKWRDLTGEQKFFLQWLAKEEYAQLRECKGKTLDALCEYGLVAKESQR